MEDSQCNSLDFQLGTTGIDATLPTNRGWNIKVLALLNLYGICIPISPYTLILISDDFIQITQIDCNSELRAPQGCTQWFYGSNSQDVRTFNFNAGQGLHLGMIIAEPSPFKTIFRI